MLFYLDLESAFFMRISIKRHDLKALNLTHHEVVPSKGTVWFLCRVPMSINCLWQLISLGNLQRVTFKLSGAIFKQSMTVLGSNFEDTKDLKEESRLNTSLIPILYAGLTTK